MVRDSRHGGRIVGVAADNRGSGTDAGQATGFESLDVENPCTSFRHHDLILSNKERTKTRASEAKTGLRVLLV
jgi:hypothetical protein